MISKAASHLSYSTTIIIFTLIISDDGACFYRYDDGAMLQASLFAFLRALFDAFTAERAYRVIMLKRDTIH